MVTKRFPVFILLELYTLILVGAIGNGPKPNSRRKLAVVEALVEKVAVEIKLVWIVAEIYI